MTEAKFTKLVLKARQFVRSYDKTRWLIAEIAMEACDYHHGGRTDTLFTFTRFAKEIDINRKTLMQWIRYKRNVVDKLQVKYQEKIDSIPLDLIDRVDRRVTNSSKITDVRKIFLEESNQNPNNRKFYKYNKVLKTIIFNVSKPVQMMDMSDDDLLDMQSKAKLIVSFIDKELEFRERFGKPSGISTSDQISKVTQELESMV